MIGATAAALASAGLVYWIGAAEDPAPSAPRTTSEDPAPRAYAPIRADAAAIIRAHEQLQTVYAEGGSASVTRFGQACSDHLATRPQDLDFCISFNAFSSHLESSKARVGASDDLGLVRAALPPGQDAEARLAQIRLLAREVSLKDRPGPVSEIPKAAPAEKPLAKASSPRIAKRRAPALRSDDARLRGAYQRAAAAGVNASRLGREQRQFRRAVQNAPDRAAVARLYARRIRTLEAQARGR